MTSPMKRNFLFEHKYMCKINRSCSSDLQVLSHWFIITSRLCCSNARISQRQVTREALVRAFYEGVPTPHMGIIWSIRTDSCFARMYQYIVYIHLFVHVWCTLFHICRVCFLTHQNNSLSTCLQFYSDAWNILPKANGIHLESMFGQSSEKTSYTTKFICPAMQKYISTYSVLSTRLNCGKMLREMWKCINTFPVMSTQLKWADNMTRDVQQWWTKR